MSSKILPFAIAGLVICVILLMMCAFQVAFTEAVVVTRFDRISRIIEPKDAGLQWKLPWPIDRVHRFDTRRRSFDTEFRQVGTKDQKTIILTSYATWRVDNAERFLNTIGREDSADQKIRDLLQNQVEIVLKTRDLSELVNVDPAKLKFGEIEAQFLAGIVDTAHEKYGIEINSVGIMRMGIPDTVSKEVFARMKEERQKTIKELTAEGNAKATQIREEARSAASKIAARAEAYAKNLEAQGEAEAAKFYKFFAENPELSDFLKKRETLLEIFRAGNITLVLNAREIQPFDQLDRAASRTSAAGPNAKIDHEILAGQPGDAGPTGAPKSKNADDAPRAAAELEHGNEE